MTMLNMSQFPLRRLGFLQHIGRLAVLSNARNDSGNFRYQKPACFMKKHANVRHRTPHMFAFNSPKTIIQMFWHWAATNANRDFCWSAVLPFITNIVKLQTPPATLAIQHHGTYLYIPANIFASRLWSGSRFCALIVLNPVCSVSLPKSLLTDHSLNTSAVVNLLSDRGVAKAQVDWCCLTPI